MIPSGENGSSHLYGMIAQNRSQALSIGSTTDNLPEGSANLYFTATRARSVYTVNAPLTYNQSLGVLSVTGYTGSIQVLVDVDFVAQTKTFKTLTYSNGVLTNVV